MLGEMTIQNIVAMSGEAHNPSSSSNIKVDWNGKEQIGLNHLNYFIWNAHIFMSFG